MKKYKYILFLGLLFLGKAHSQAVIAFVMPPGTTESGVGGAGVSNSTDLNSLFYNPAILSNLYNTTGNQIHYLLYESGLVPEIEISRLFHRYTAFGFSSRQFYDVFNIGVGYYKNYISFGEIPLGNEDGKERSFYAEEQVEAITLSLRLFDYIGVGVNLKSTISKFTPEVGLNSNSKLGKIKSQDIGILVSHKYTILNSGLYVEPLFGVTFINSKDSILYSNKRDSVLHIVENDSIWSTELFYDRIAYEKWMAYTLRVGFLELFEVSHTFERKWNLVREYKPHTNHYGFGFKITPFFKYTLGKLEDKTGERDERNFSLAMIFDINNILILKERFLNQDFSTSYFDLLNKRKSFNFWGFHFRPNLRFQFSSSVILEGEIDGIRNGQKAYQLSISL